jgi:hypothetical protein
VAFTPAGMAPDLSDASPWCLRRSRHPHAVFWLFTPFAMSTLQRRHPRLSSTTSPPRWRGLGVRVFPVVSPPWLPPRSIGPTLHVTVGGEFPVRALSVAPRVPRSPMVHFPSVLSLATASRLPRRCVSVVRVFSSTLLPGFTGPESSVLPVDLPSSAPFPFRDYRYRVRFLRPLPAAGQEDFPG